MNRKMHLRTDGLFFPFRFNQQIVCSGIQVRVGDDRLAARAVPVFGEAFQLVNDFILIILLFLNYATKVILFFYMQIKNELFL